MSNFKFAGNRLGDYLKNNKYANYMVQDTNRKSEENASQTTQEPVQTPKFDFGEINGDNNVQKVGDITQIVDYSDNSRYYGDNVRKFTYNGSKGKNKLYDTPVSMATLGGYYDVDDSPKATSQFLDKYINENRLAQRQNDKDYAKYGTFDYSSDKSRAIDADQFYKRMESTVNDSYTNANRETEMLFGNLGNLIDSAPKWEHPDPPRPPKDFEDIAEDAEEAVD